jgi:hypothetical protein
MLVQAAQSLARTGYSPTIVMGPVKRQRVELFGLSQRLTTRAIGLHSIRDEYAPLSGIAGAPCRLRGQPRFRDGKLVHE